MIFLSYRRGDTAGHAGRLFDRLAHRFGNDQVFMDVDTIRPGEDFAKAVVASVNACRVLVALIGDDWVSASEEQGRRLDNPADFVRLEIAAAIARGIPIIPVLVEGAALPRAEELPEDLRPLLRYQAFEIRDTRFDAEAQDLIRTIEVHIQSSAVRDLGKPLPRRPSTWAWVGLGIAALVGLLALILYPIERTGELSGRWRAEVTDSRGQEFSIILNLRIQAGQVLGEVSYPTGTGSIEEGVIQGNRISFVTRHLPQFAEQPATTRFAGDWKAGELRLTMQSSASVFDLIAKRLP
jgi:hypothetical protein